MLQSSATVRTSLLQKLFKSRISKIQSVILYKDCTLYIREYTESVQRYTTIYKSIHRVYREYTKVYKRVYREYTKVHNNCIQEYTERYTTIYKSIQKVYKHIQAYTKVYKSIQRAYTSNQAMGGDHWTTSSATLNSEYEYVPPLVCVHISNLASLHQLIILHQYTEHKHFCNAYQIPRALLEDTTQCLCISYSGCFK